MNKKILYAFLYIIFIFSINVIPVKAANLTLEDKDFVLECTYADGSLFTVDYDKMFFRKGYNDISDVNSNYLFIVPDNVSNIFDENGNIIEYRYSKWLGGEHCPLNLTKLEGTVITGEIYEDNDPTDDLLDYTEEDYYLYTFTNINGGILNWPFESDEKNALLSAFKEAVDGSDHSIDTFSKAKKYPLTFERYYLNTSKKADLIYNYAVHVEDDHTTSQPAKLYFYDNVALFEMGGVVSRVNNINGEGSICNRQTSYANCLKESIYVNSLAPNSVGGSSSVSYNSTNYYINLLSYGQSCREHNNNKACVKLDFIGDGNVEDESTSSDNRVCELLGNNTVNIIKEIIGWLQIIVPGLMIVLIGFDIGKMVVSGNLDEELPKKKKIIFIRLIILVFFFFAPLLTKVFIEIMKVSKVDIGQIQCIVD